MNIYRIKITLDYIAPPIWRRIEVPAEIPLGRLHDVIQAAMDWEDAHMHCFTIDGVSYSAPNPGGLGDMESERGVRLGDLVSPGTSFRYEYDFGDSWLHQIKVERAFEAESGVRYPRCIDGARACPPEDCGGFPGYFHLLEILA